MSRRPLKTGQSKVKHNPDYAVVDAMLWEWSDAVRESLTLERVAQVPGSSETIYGESGKVPAAWKNKSREPNVKAAQQQEFSGRPPAGTVHIGLQGRPAMTERIMRSIYQADKPAAMVVRTEYGLVPGIDRTEPTAKKAKLLGQYLGGKAWSESLYREGRRRALNMFVSMLVFSWS